LSTLVVVFAHSEIAGLAAKAQLAQQISHAYFGAVVMLLIAIVVIIYLNILPTTTRRAAKQGH
jgi:hypothetical protein